MSASKVLLTITVALTGLLVACDGPCTNLAEKICECEPNETRERACLVNVDLSTRDPIEEENARCEALLKTCTCAALDRGDFEACGLALPGDES